MFAWPLATQAVEVDAPLMQVKLVPKTFSGGYHLTCFGANNGSIQTVVTDGTAPYTYSWNTGATTETLEHAIAGTYSVTVTDAQGVTATASIDLLQPKLLEVEATSKLLPGGTHISKAGGNDGKASADVMGGTPPYTYLWSTTNGTAATNGSTKDGVYDLEAGTYSVTVEDVNGCSVSASVTLTEPTPLNVSLSATTYNGGTNISCAKGTDGSITASVTGGIAPYKLAWSNGQFTETATELSAGNHRLLVTDANGVELGAELELIAPSPMQVEVSAPIFSNGFHVSCHSCFNGTVNSTVSGGTAPYQYRWVSKSGAEVGQAAQLANAGEAGYSLEVTDGNGCKAEALIGLKIPERDDWRMGGNTNVQAGQFLGTTDATDVEFRANNQPQLRLGADGVTEVVQQLRMSNLNELVPNENTEEPRILVLNNDGSVAAAPPPPPEGFLPYWQDRHAATCWDAVSSPLEILGSWSYDVNEIYSCPQVNVGLGTDEPIAKLDVRTGSIMIGYAPAYSAPFTDAELDVKGRVIISTQQNVGPAYTNAMLDVRASSNDAAFTIEALDKDGLSSFRVRNNGKVIVGNGAFNDPSIGKASLFLGNEHYNISATAGVGFGLSAHYTENYDLYIPENTSDVRIPNRLEIGTRRIENGPHTDYALTVDGKIVATEIVVTTDEDYWADYVFEENYELRGLNDVESFINENGHLPDVPSAKEIEERGQDLGKMDAILLRKIEELTLYVIELEKKLNEIDL